MAEEFLAGPMRMDRKNCTVMLAFVSLLQMLLAPTKKKVRKVRITLYSEHLRSDYLALQCRQLLRCPRSGSVDVILDIRSFEFIHYKLTSRSDPLCWQFQ